MPNEQPRPSTGVVMLGTLLLLAAITASGMMVLRHFLKVELPGCGAGSPCDAAAASRWGTVPVLNLPTSFVGLAFFTALLIAWTGSHGALSTASRTLARLGALVSLAFLAIIAVEKLACPYCLIAHACNLFFVALAEFGTRRARTSAHTPFITAAAVGIAALATMGVADHRAKKEAQAKAEQALAESTRQMTQPRPPAAPAQPTDTPAAPTNTAKGFSGRYAWGPEKAPVRIVMYTDYQCPDCKRIEGELAELQSNPSIAVIIKHFPLCSACNPKAPNLHPNGCWAARAAQAAGILQGDEGFWKMHYWLFSQGGSFTDASLPPALQQLGFDPRQFQQVMQSQETLDRVKADVQEGYDRGLFFTPLIYINGVELKGWNAPNALTRAVTAVLASNPEPRSFADDAMPSALDKYMSDWRESPVRQLPTALMQRALGPADAPVTVVVFGDYMEPGTQEADGVLRLFATGPTSKIRYSFAHFPVNSDCNPAVPNMKKFDSCRAALAAEAAQMMGGDEAFWKVHDWMMLSKGIINNDSLGAAASLLDTDPATLSAAMQNPTPAATIQAHARAGQSLGLTSIPMIFINGKHVPRFKLDNENLLPRMIDEAASRP
ncbi:MAG TPA: thioredoxin domain-containing protein [Phycisphaerales bacterium]|nr:thioredoxin domain-containing protein [Phycisphaerales bacterium]